MGRVLSMRRPMAGATARRHRNELGNPTENVVANANRSSFDNRLCRCVVPVRGCPSTNTGSSLSSWFATARPYTSQSQSAKKEFKTDMHVMKSSRGQYVKTSMLRPCLHTILAHCAEVMPLRG
jgi:hypothetical protein